MAGEWWWWWSGVVKGKGKATEDKCRTEMHSVEGQSDGMDGLDAKPNVRRPGLVSAESKAKDVHDYTGYSVGCCAGKQVQAGVPVIHVSE